jgi:Lrp/AsnC family leucine-responsive transcriptional regulator
MRIQTIHMLLDETDRTLLRELDRDVRVSLTQLAKKARISKEKVHYRLRRLEESVITGYWAQQRVGHPAGAYKIFLKDKSLGKRKAELLSFIAQYKGAAWIAETEGRWDVVISNYATTDAEFITFVNQLLKQFGTALREKAIIKMTRAISLNEKYLHKKPYVRIGEDDFTQNAPAYDDVDRSIINALASNARVSYTELAKITGLSSEAISYRFRKLRRENAFVDLKVRINHQALGLSYYHVLLSLEHYEMKDAILQYYTHHPHCVYIMTHLGMYDIHLELVLSPEEIANFLTDLSERFGSALNAYEVLRIVTEHRMRIEQ